MTRNERALQIAFVLAALIAAALMARHGSQPARTAALLSGDGLVCSRFAGQNQ